MTGIELLLLLLPATAVLTRVANRIGAPYPIVLLVAGVGVGFISAVPDIALAPDVVFLVFLPPLLYLAAYSTSPRQLAKDALPIASLAVGLVVATAGGVAVVAHMLIPGMPWAVALTLGAVVGPTDPAAATAVFGRFSVRPRLVTLVEGESMVNDGAALVLYAAAVGIAVSGEVHPGSLVLTLLLAPAGGAAIGCVVGWFVVRFRRRLDDPLVEIAMALSTPYLAYLAADAVGASGVLAVVAAGLYVGWNAPQILTPGTRLQAGAFFDVLVYLLNAALFLLLGLTLPNLLKATADPSGGPSGGRLVAGAVAVTLTVVLLRLAWMVIAPPLTRWVLGGRTALSEKSLPRGERFLVGWAGMRGGVSLAAALSIPTMAAAGGTFPRRDVVLLFTVAVLATTLVLQGFTLPPLVAWLAAAPGEGGSAYERSAREMLARSALDRLDELADSDWVTTNAVEQSRGLYERRLQRYGSGGAWQPGEVAPGEVYRTLRKELLDAERQTLGELRSSGEVDLEVVLRLERDLDLEDSRLRRF